MIPVSLRFRAGLFITLLGTAGFSLAGDVLKLRDGTKLDGTILSETDAQVVIELITGGIKDTKTVAKKDITEMIKATPDQVASAELAKLLPSKDLMSDAEYQTILNEKLLPFGKKFPASPYKKDVDVIVKTYQDEMAKAKAGSKKVEGTWITAQEVDWNAYNFEARLRRAEFQTLLKAGKYDAAYHILAELERDKPASIETVTALELFKAAIPQFDEVLDLRILEHPIRTKEAVESLKTLTPDQKRDFEEAKKQAAADFKARQDEDRKAKLGILPFDAMDLKSIQDAKAALKKEADRINKIDLVKTREAAVAFQTGLKNLYEKSYLSAQRNFEISEKAFPKESFVKDRLAVAKKAASEDARVKNEAGLIPSATKPGDPKTGAKTPEPAKTAAGAPVKKVAPPTEKEDGEEVAVVEEKSNMPIYLIAGAAALLIVGLIVKALGKKKAAAAED